VDKKYVEHGMKPFWFWNGEMKDEEITRQIKEMADKGIGGFFIHPRQGNTLPYMSNQWFEKVGVAIEAAKKYGLEVWLYDEYPYPSGICAGEVVNGHPEYEARILKVNKFDINGPQEYECELPWGEVIMAAAYPVENGEVNWKSPIRLEDEIGNNQPEKIYHQSLGLTAYNTKRFMSGNLVKKLHWKVPAGSWRVYIFIQVPVRGHKYFDSFVDPVNPEAVRRFIELTHERYKRHFGHEFGKTIKGIFSDEISPMGAPMWSPLMPKLFREKNGYDLIEYLPALFDDMGEGTDKFRYDYNNTITNAFIESYDMQIHNWCRENGILYVGEKPILRSSQIQHMDIQGMDAGHQKAGDETQLAHFNYRVNAKIAESGAFFYKKKKVLCECYHSIGWSMTIQDMKWIIDWLAVQGVSMFVPHGFFYTTDALAKHDAPPSSFYQMPAWKHMGKLSEYMADLLDTITKASKEVDVLIMDPVTSTWTAMGSKRDANMKLRMDFSRLQRELLENHMDYYVIDPELLVQSEINDGQLKINDTLFKVLLIPPVTNIDSKTLNFIDRYLSEGGILITCGSLPAEEIEEGVDPTKVFDKHLGINSRSIYNNYLLECKREAELMRAARNRQRRVGSSDTQGVKFDDAQDLKANENLYIRKGNAVFVADIQKVVDIVKEFIPKKLSITSEDKEIYGIIAARYKTEEGYCYFLVNTTGKAFDASLRLFNEVGADVSLSINHLGEEMEKSRLSFGQGDGYINVSLHFSPFESYMLCLKNKNVQKTVAGREINDTGRVILGLDGKWNFKIRNLNSLRLYDWDLEVQYKEDDRNKFGVGGSYEYTAKSKGKVGSMPIIDQITRSRIPLPLKATEQFGVPKRLEFPNLNVKYTSDFVIDKMTDMWLVMEPGSISGEWYIDLNGSKIEPSDFTNREIYMPSNLACNITPIIKEGTNRIAVYVRTKKTYDGVVNPLYICGNFGVYKDKTSNDDKIANESKAANKEEISGGCWRIGSLPGSGEMFDMEVCGLPFYAGEIEYEREMVLQVKDCAEETKKDDSQPSATSAIPDEVSLYIDDLRMQSTALLEINGVNAGVKAWSPYIWNIAGKDININGKNTVKLTVTTGLLGLFEGKSIDPVTRKMTEY